MARKKTNPSDWNTTPVWVYDYSNDMYYKAIRHMVVNDNTTIYAEIIASYDCNDDGELIKDSYKECPAHFEEIFPPKWHSTICINENLSALTSLISSACKVLEDEKNAKRETLIKDIVALLEEYGDKFEKQPLVDKIQDSHISYLFSGIRSPYSDHERNQRILSIIETGGIDIKTEDRENSPHIFIPFSNIIGVQSYECGKEYIEFTRSDGFVIKRTATPELRAIKQAIHYLWRHNIHP